MRPRKTLLFPLLAQVAVWFLIFAGWGLDAFGGFFAHPARAALVGVTLGATAFMLVAVPDMDPFRQGTRPVGRQRGLLALFVATLIFLAWWLPYGDRRGRLVFADSDLLRYVGLVIHITGASIRLLGLWTLGRQFSSYVTLQENHQLVQSGIYSLVRHPIYLGLLLAFPGWALVFRSWLAVPLVGLMGAYVAARMHQEERLLAERFGAEFDAYRRRTWRLLPYLY